MQKKKKIGEILIEMKLVTPKQLEAALEKQKRTGYKIGSILTSMGYLTEIQLTEVLSRIFGIKKWNYLDFQLSPELKSSIPRDIILKENFLPVKLSQQVITVAVSQQPDLNLISDLEFSLNKNIELVIAPEDVIRRFIYKIYILNEYQLSWQEIVDDFNNIDIQLNAETAVSNYKEELKVQNVIQNIDNLIRKIFHIALSRRAEAISFTPHLSTFIIFIEKEGKREVLVRGPKSDYYANIIHRIKMISGMPVNIYTKILTDGHLELSSKRMNLKALSQITSYPTIHGEYLKVDIKYKMKINRELENFGIDGKTLSVISQKINSKRPHGMMIITGEPKGAKELAYLILRKKSDSLINIRTLEKNIEIEMPNVLQSSDRYLVGSSAKERISTLLLDKPDIVYIEDGANKDILKEVINSSTQNTFFIVQLPFNDMLSSIFYLLSLDLPPYNILNSLDLAINITIFKKLCPDCKLELDENSPVYDELMERIPSGKFNAFAPIGCEKCKYSGFDGEVGVFDTLAITKELKMLILSSLNNYPTMINEIKKRKFRNNYVDAMNKVAFGIIDFTEVKEKLL